MTRDSFIYNRREHEKWIQRAQTDPISCTLVLADFEWRKGLFVGDMTGAWQP